mmetsp:Transcript_41552/g.61513  ORF Transcript_41552/g.61513 Transcript_41552/m.61513 type:complete len:268 (+) Transcript_41552:3-806(+)
MKEEGLLTRRSTCSLNQCAFGSFVAKEIEDMGLPLPHSDLIQLSTMNFSSYARSLWRHHRHVDNNGSRGRLLVLLAEMATKDNRIHDQDLVSSLLREMIRLNLTRTLLTTCERLVGISGTESDESLREAMSTAAKGILADFHRFVHGSLTKCVEKEVLETVQRLGKLVQRTAYGSVKGQQQMVQFCTYLVALMPHMQESNMRNSMLEMVSAAASQIEEDSIRASQLSSLKAFRDDQSLVVNNDRKEAEHDSLSNALRNVELSLLASE